MIIKKINSNFAKNLCTVYSITDYLFNGLLYLNNTLRPHHKRLSQLMLYANTMCQSRCKHCNIWQKPHEYLTLDQVKAIVGSKCVTRRTVVGLEGGEFLLHPQAKEIMAWLQENHPKYTLLSNGLAPQLVIEAVRQYHPVRLYLSLDGPRDTYKVMRGRDGYDHVIKCIETLHREIPISLMFCLSPWNSMKDMEHVIGIAKKYDIDVRIGIYGTMDFFDTTAEMIPVEGYLDSIPQSIHQTQENYDFVALYDQWRRGHLRLRCQSIFSSLVIHSDGQVPLCQNLGVTLGDLRKQTLDEIFNGDTAVKAQCQYSKECNQCWINFHRKYDIILVRNMERLLPKWLIEKFYGKYQWTDDTRTTYRKHLKDIQPCCNK